jgi:hypothetical protein
MPMRSRTGVGKAQTMASEEVVMVTPIFREEKRKKLWFSWRGFPGGRRKGRAAAIPESDSLHTSRILVGCMSCQVGSDMTDQKENTNTPAGRYNLSPLTRCE